MNKAEFVAAVAEKADLSKAAAAGAVDAVIETITKARKQAPPSKSKRPKILASKPVKH